VGGVRGEGFAEAGHDAAEEVGVRALAEVAADFFVVEEGDELDDAAAAAAAVGVGGGGVAFLGVGRRG